MQAQQYLANIYCSEEFNQGLDNKGISLSAINILLGITAIIGNTVILIALCKETSLHKPSKVLLRNLVASDLCVGFVQLAFGARGISILQGRWETCRHLYLVYGIAGNISISVSLCTITTISVDRLLALLIKLRYREVVTVTKVYAIAIVSWICIGIGFASLWYFSPDRWIVFSLTTIAVCLIISTYCYARIFFRLRHQHTQVHNNLREETQTRMDITRYRKTVSSALWLQLTLLFCYLPYLLLMPFAYLGTENNLLSIFSITLDTTITLMLFNSTLNPILYCWRIKEVRRAVKDTLSCSRM
ncbi:melanocortin receptor 5-like [Acropora millepora]|uniref:melanocortin receptor 5-like n=1 Tax=Acropora millepora TaxID=45264 RepID=UPI001CF5E268|nr:melanocortin receptor 5-like [Acropora millepora]